MAKETLDKAYALVDKMTTAEQLQLQGYIQKVLDDKAAEAEKELSLIKNNGKGGDER